MSAEQPRLPAALTAVAVGPIRGGDHNGGTTAVTTSRRRSAAAPRSRALATWRELRGDDARP